MIKLIHNNKYGYIIISIILGFGLGTLFRKSCEGNDCYVYKAPELNKIHNQTFKYNNKCYKYTLLPSTCNKIKKQY